MAKKQELNLGGLMMGVTSRLSGAMEEVESTTNPSTEIAPSGDVDANAKQEDETPAQIEDNSQDANTDYQHNQQQTQVAPPAQKLPAAPTENANIELAIDDDINMYTGLTKPVSFALPKDIKRALDNFVDDYNDARPTKKTTQAKVVAQALRNFLAIYQ